MIPVDPLDRTAVRELPKLLGPALAKDKPRIAVDLSKADRVDASGLAILVTWMKKTRQSGGDMLIVNPSDRAAGVEAHRAGRRFSGRALAVLAPTRPPGETTPVGAGAVPLAHS